MGWQEALTFLVVAAAVAYIVYKFVLEPRFREKRPHVAASALSRKRRPPPPKTDDCCG